MTIPTVALFVLTALANAAPPPDVFAPKLPSTEMQSNSKNNGKRRSKKRKKKPKDAPFQGRKVLVTGALVGNYASMRESKWVLPPDATKEDAEWQACEADPDCNITDSDNNAANGWGWGGRTGLWLANVGGNPGLNVGVLYGRSTAHLEGQARMVPKEADSTSILQEYVGDRADYDVKLNHLAIGVLFQGYINHKAKVYAQGRLMAGGAWADLETTRKTKPNKTAEGTMGGGAFMLDAGVGKRFGKHVGLAFLVPLINFDLAGTKPKSRPTDMLPFIDNEAATNWRMNMGVELAVAF